MRRIAGAARTARSAGGLSPASCASLNNLVAPGGRSPTMGAMATITSSVSSRPRTRGVIRIRRASRPTARRPAVTGATVIAGSPARPLEPEPDLADLDLVAEGKRREAVDLAAVHERAVGRAKILHVPGPTPIRQRGVRRGDEVVVEHD